MVERGAVVAELVGRDPATKRLPVRCGENPELADEAAQVLRVAPVRHALRGRLVSACLLAEAARRVAVPDLPVVHVAVLTTVVIVAAERRAGPVRRAPVALG